MKTEALIKLWNATQKHPGTSGARVAACVLLGLYNGDRFPVNLTDLRMLDGDLTTAALDVIESDARRCEMEVHHWLNELTGRSDFQARIESLAHEYSVKGRCRRSELPSVTPARVVIVERDEVA